MNGLQTSAWNPPRTSVRRRVVGTFRASLVVVATFAMTGAWASAQERQPGAAKPSPAKPATIDDELLRDLPPVAPKAKGAETPPPTREKGTQEEPVAKPKTPPTGTEPAAKPLTSDEGEDVNLVGPEEFLRDIRRRMKQVEQRLRSQDASRSTQSEQEKIAAELESFISQLQRSSSSSRAEKSKDGGSGVGSDQTGGTQQATKGKAVESSDRNSESTRPGDVPGAEVVETGEVWGALPPQLRQQIQNLSSDRFLPQYERLIQQYYRRLAERK